MSITLHTIKSTIAHAFADIGKSDDTYPSSAPPSNTFALVWEYYVADMLASMANKRKDEAKEACLSAGLLGDRAKMAPGNMVETYNSELLSIHAKMNNPASRIDKAKLRSELIKALGANNASKVLNACTKENAAAVSYEFSVNA